LLRGSAIRLQACLLVVNAVISMGGKWPGKVASPAVGPLRAAAGRRIVPSHAVARLDRPAGGPVCITAHPHLEKEPATP